MSLGTTRGESYSISLVLATALALSVGAIPSAEAETITWANLAGGTWNTAANWNPADVPNEAGEEALVANDGGTYTITLNLSPGLDALAIQNPTATLNLGSSTLTLLQPAGLSNAGLIRANTGNATIAGPVFNQSAGRVQTLNNCDLYLPGQTVSNEGTITINAPAGTGNSNLVASGNVILDGSGVLRMVTSGAVNDAELETSAGFTLTQQASHSIRGAGTINAALINHGTVMADESGRTLWLTVNPKSNDGTLGAAAGCYLNLGPMTLTQGPGGQLLGDEGAVRLESGATIVGGSFATNGGGKVTTVTGGPVTIEDIHNLGRFDVIPATVHLRGTLITNDGTITLNPAGSSSNSVLTFIEDVALSGSGQCVMVAATDANDARIESSAGVTGTHGSGHTIRGSGTISAALVNEGLISGDDPVRALELTTNPKTNAATLQAVPGGRLNIIGCMVTQTPGGTILADGAVVGLGDGSTIAGGTLATSGTGTVATISGATATLEDVHNLGRFDVIPATVHLRGTLTTNDGTIALNPDGSSSNSFLVFVENAALGGSGECVMVAATGSNDANIETSAGITGTNGSGHTIRGSGTISAALVNEGLISGDDPVRALDLVTNPKNNAGTLQAIDGGRLNITGCTVVQGPGATISADNAVVGLGAGGTVMGGTLTSANGGAVRSDAGTATLEGVTNIGTLQILGNGSAITVNGSSFVNEGLIAVNYSGIVNNATLRFAETCALTGSGEVLLRVGGVTPEDAVITTLGDAVLTVGVDQVVHGSGYLRAQMTNQGTIMADDPAWDLICDSDDLVNQGVLRAESGGDLLVSSGTITNLATAAAIDTSRIIVGSYGILKNRGQITAADEGLLLVNSNGQLINDESITAGALGHFNVTDGSIKNYGTVRAEAQGAVRVDYGTYWSEGLTAVAAGGSFWTDRMQASGHYSGSTLTGGTWQVESGGSMRLIGCNVQTLKAGAVLVGAGATIYSNDGTTDALAGLTSIQAGGLLEVRTGRDYGTPGNLTNAFGGLAVGAGCAFTVAGQYTQTGNGEIDRGLACVDGTLDTNAGTLAISSGTLCGSGTILDDVTSGGWVKPGSLSGSLIGTLAVAGGYTQSADGTFDVQLGGTEPGESDLLDVAGQAALAGRLIVRSIEGYTPQVGDRFTILECGSRTGQFAIETGCPGLGLIYDTFYYADRVEIEILGDASAVPEPELAGDPQEPGEEADPAAPGTSDPAAEDSGGGAGQAGATRIPTAVSLAARPLGSGAAALELSLPESAEIDLRLYDLNGRQVAIVARGFEAAGVHDYALRGESFRRRSLPAGIYLAAARIRSASGTQRAGARVLLIR